MRFLRPLALVVLTLAAPYDYLRLVPVQEYILTRSADGNCDWEGVVMPPFSRLLKTMERLQAVSTAHRASSTTVTDGALTTTSRGSTRSCTDADTVHLRILDGFLSPLFPLTPDCGHPARSKRGQAARLREETGSYSERVPRLALNNVRERQQCTASSKKHPS